MNFREAASAAHKLGAFIELIQRAQGVLETVANAEQHESDLAQRIVKLEADAATAARNTGETIAAKVAAEKSLEALLLQIRKNEEDARATVAATLESARNEAETIRAEAHKIREQAVDVQRQVKEQKDTADRYLSQARADLAEVLLKVDQAKAAARKLFGG